MAVPTFTHDLTALSAADTTTGWVTVVGAMLSAVDGLQGSGAILNTYVATGTRGTAFDRGAGLGIDMTGKLFYIWMLVGGAGFVDTKANGGMWVQLASDAASVTTNYKRWYVGGSDTDWVKDGGWRRVVIDPSRTADVTGGTFDITNVRWFGGGSNVIVTAMAAGTTIDIIHYGTKFEITGGTDGDAITLQGVVDKDAKAVDDTLYGVVFKNSKADTFDINATLLIGDESGTSTTVFETIGDNVMFADQPLSSTGMGLVAKQDTGATTKIIMGKSTGAGESKVGFGGTVFNRLSAVFGVEPKIDLSVAVNTLTIYGSTFKRIGRGVVFGANSGHEVISTVFNSCSQVDLGSVFARDLLFTGYTLDTLGALLWNGSINIKRSSFFANTDATNNPAAIEHPAQGTFTYDTLEFAGNDFDINYTAPASSGVLTINNDVSLTSKILNPTGNSVVVVAGAVTFSVTAKDLDTGAVIENARVMVPVTSGVNFPYQASVSIAGSGTLATVTHATHGRATGDNILIAGVAEDVFNGAYTITVTGASTYTYTAPDTLPASATGSPTATMVLLNGLTNASGVISDTRTYSAAQPVSGWVRKATGSPLYRQAPVADTISATNGLSVTVFLQPDE